MCQFLSKELLGEGAGVALAAEVAEVAVRAIGVAVEAAEAVVITGVAEEVEAVEGEQREPASLLVLPFVCPSIVALECARDRPS